MRLKQDRFTAGCSAAAQQHSGEWVVHGGRAIACLPGGVACSTTSMSSAWVLRSADRNTMVRLP